MNVFERSGDLVGMSAVSDLVNGWPGGIIQANRHAVFVSPIYLVNQLYNEHLGAERLSANVVSPTFDSSREGRRVPYLDAVVSRSADGRQIFIKAVNTDRARPLVATVIVRGALVAPRGEMATVGATSLSASNDFSNPVAVSIKRSQIRAGQAFKVEFPKHSVSVITLRASRITARQATPVARGRLVARRGRTG
jgi:alpha-N-arabinofuranosidase